VCFFFISTDNRIGGSKFQKHINICTYNMEKKLIAVPHWNICTAQHWKIYHTAIVTWPSVCHNWSFVYDFNGINEYCVFWFHWVLARVVRHSWKKYAISYSRKQIWYSFIFCIEDGQPLPVCLKMACIQTGDSIPTIHRLTVQYLAIPWGSVTDNNSSQPEVNLVSDM